MQKIHLYMRWLGLIFIITISVISPIINRNQEILKFDIENHPTSKPLHFINIDSSLESVSWNQIQNNTGLTYLHSQSY